MDQAAQEVTEAIKNGIDLIREGAGLQTTLATFVIQIAATLVLFLYVRLFLWKRVTSMLDARKKAQQDALDELNNMKDDTDRLKQDASTIISDAKKDALNEKEEIIIEAKNEAKTIKNEAQIEAKRMIDEANENIEQEISNARQQVKEEIIDVAYALSEKIVEREIDRKKNQDLVDSYLEDIK